MLKAMSTMRNTNLKNITRQKDRDKHLRDKMPQVKNEVNICKPGGTEEEDRKQALEYLKKKKKKKASPKYGKISIWRLKGVTMYQEKQRADKN